MNLAPSAARDRRLALWLIAGFALVRLIGGGLLGLGVDESYAVAVGREFSLSYYDHPPLTFWLTRVSAHLFGTEAHLAVRAPFLLMGAVSGWLLYLLTMRLFGSRAGVWALAGWSIAPFFLFSGAGWIVPDGPLVVFTLLAALLAWPLFAEGKYPHGSRWLAVGAAIAMAFLAKYHAALFGLGLAVVVLTTARGRTWLVTPWPYLGGAVAALGAVPVILWNVDHGWQSVAFQAGRAGDGASVAEGLVNGLTMVAGQLFYLLPATFAIGLLVAWRAARAGPSAPAGWFCLWLGLPNFAVFNAIAFVSEGSLPHWPIPGFLFFLPLIGAWAASREAVWGQALRRATVAGGVFSLVLYAALIAHSESGVLTRPFTETAPAFDDTTQIADWDVVAEALAARGIPESLPVAAVNWTEAAKLAYALGPGRTVLVLNEDRRHFGFLESSTAAVSDPVLVIELIEPGDALPAGAVSAAGLCDGVAAPPIAFPRGGLPYAAFSVTMGRLCR